MAYAFLEPVIGAPQVSDQVTIAPGNANLPSTVLEAQLGEIRKAWDPTLGGAEFIYLQIPASTAFPLGTVVVWDQAAGATAGGYVATISPVGATMKQSGQSCAISPGFVSNASVTYGWFQIQGVASILKTAVTVNPAVAIYFSATTGRIKVLSSTGQQVLGARTANLATVTSTTSTVLVYIDRPRAEGV